MSSKKTGTPGINRTHGMIQKTRQTGTSGITVANDMYLIKTKYDEKRIDDIYSNIKKFLTKYKGDKKEDKLHIANVMLSEIYDGQIPGFDNNLYNFEVLLAVLRYLSRTKKPYNKRRIELLKQFIELSEQTAFTNIFKSSTFEIKRVFVTIEDIEYYKVAKEYLKKINKKFKVDTSVFNHNNDDELKKNEFLRKNKFNVYFISNTGVKILIKDILNKNVYLKSESRTKSSSHSSRT